MGTVIPHPLCLAQIPRATEAWAPNRRIQATPGYGFLFVAALVSGAPDPAR
jgi:hypothetical protein